MPDPMKLPPLDEWKAPWEKEGEDFDPANFDNGKARRFLHGLLADKDRLKQTNANLMTELGEARTELTKIKSKDESDVERLTRELEEARKKPVETLNKAQLLLDLGAEKGLTVTQIKAASRYVGGETAEEIEANFESYVTDHSLGGDGDKDTAGPKSRPVPASKTITGVDQIDNDLTDEGHYKDPGKAYEQFLASR